MKMVMPWPRKKIMVSTDNGEIKAAEAKLKKNGIPYSSKMIRSKSQTGMMRDAMVCSRALITESQFGGNSPGFTFELYVATRDYKEVLRLLELKPLDKVKQP